MTHWAQEAVFYHIYPLGQCGAPHHNDFNAPPQARIAGLAPWLEHAADLGSNAVLLGPVMESGSHGYDVADYFNLDRRLGTNADLAELAALARDLGLRLVLDGVFHHVGREFWAFRDVREHGPGSRFAGWFHLDFNQRSPLGDPFAYETWNGCDDLVKLNLANPEVKSHLLEAVAAWLREYHIHGLRLDAADSLPMEFMSELAEHCRRLKSDFWLMGEVLHGDYRRWVDEGGLDSVTNYECYKGLFSSLREANMFEIAHSLRRQFDTYGLYRGLSLYSFADNHDVNRVASRLTDQRQLFPLYCLLFTMPGVPSIYYGSEFGVPGEKAPDHDWPLRPALDLAALQAHPDLPGLAEAIGRLARLRSSCPALMHGDYSELGLGNQRLAFRRQRENQTLVVAVSAEDQPGAWDLNLGGSVNGRLVDLLNPGQDFPVSNGKARLEPLWPMWARVLELEA